MRTLVLAPALFLCAAACGCRRDPIEVRRVPKEAPSAAMAMGAPDGAAPMAASAPARRLHWTAPKGWRELPGNGMRAATFELPKGAGKAEVTVVALPGDVGGELANVNRWRGQIALPPLEESQLAGARAVVASGLGEVRVYDFTATGEAPARIVAGMFQLDGTTWFFKLTGDAKAVAAAKPSFITLLQGLAR